METKKSQAQELRRRGFSLSEIAEKLDMQKSGSISRWCQEINLTEKQSERLKKKMIDGSRQGSIVIAERRNSIKNDEVARLKEEGIKDVGQLNKRELFLTGVGIYWGEGYKYSGGEQVGFTNSDPKMILLMLRWFKKICNIQEKRITLQVKINQAHKARQKYIERYWSNITNIPLDQFTKTTLIKAKVKKLYPNPENYYGTLRITIRRGTQLRRKIHGWIEGLENNI